MTKLNSGAAFKWAISGLVLLVLGAVLGLVAAGDGTLPVDSVLMAAVLRPSLPALDRAAWLFSRIGDFSTSIVIALIVATMLIARSRPDLALFLAVAEALRGVGSGLKRVFNSPRPPFGPLPPLEAATGLGFPSGHAFGATVLYGAIAIAAAEAIPRRELARVVEVVAILMIVLIGLSRVRLGVHWPSDVAGGILSGAGLLAVLNALRLAWRPLLPEKG
jgi:undecaprenyl-diphosphatase